ncbi:MAG TPA: AI-2E family transporter [Egibacteraceae bacterium]|nr:AI-2E family transporter [Egibacteraceae bacterium]
MSEPSGAGRPLTQRPFVRVGTYAWAFVGMVVVLVVLGVVLAELTVVWVPLLLALFPAALLAPVNQRLRRVVPRWAAALVTLLGFLGLLILVVWGLVPVVAGELPALGESLRQAVDGLRDFAERSGVNVSPERIDAVIEQTRDRALSTLRGSATEILTAVAEGVTGLLLAVLALFFYLKDGERIGAWLRSLFPERARDDAEAIGDSTWWTLGAYFRGQLFIAFVDAVFIGIGIALLGVPLALPLAVLVFFGGLFPIVGAFLSGGVAVLVALADGGPVIALAVLGVVVGVQQLESNILEPVVLSRAVHLHPLAVIVALATGGVLLGVLGAFLAVPLAASGARAVAHLRARTPG